MKEMIPMNNKNTGLVLEGGAMRGLFTAGVIDVLMENGIEFPAFVGVSAGAAFGCNYKSRQIGRALRYNKRFCRDPRYCSFRSLFKTGDVFGAQFCYHEVPNTLDPFDGKAFNENPMAFYLVASDVETGKPFYKRLDRADDTAYEWIRASASMPIVSRVVELDGKKFLDGGVTDSIPLAFMERQYDRNVVVLTRPRDYQKQPASKLWLYRLTLRKYPNMLRAVRERHLMYNEQRAHVFAQEKAGKAFVICPDKPLEVGRMEHDPEQLQKAYDTGRQTALRQLGALKRFMENDH
ncbi:MAG: patatin family protein [Ruminococcus sp.]|nr:patatin family protein [Ruminococcus sp.]MBQ1813358.1 patatin family protein [Ruminococcus sp.]